MSLISHDPRQPQMFTVLRKMRIPSVKVPFHNDPRFLAFHHSGFSDEKVLRRSTYRFYVVVYFMYSSCVIFYFLGLSSYSTVELPFYSKYLLIAAYLASHNPAKTDRQFFCKTAAKKMTKRAKVIAKTGVKTTSQLKGTVTWLL